MERVNGITLDLYVYGAFVLWIAGCPPGSFANLCVESFNCMDCFDRGMPPGVIREFVLVKCVAPQSKGATLAKL
jgi:hypothetical protein